MHSLTLHGVKRVRDACLQEKKQRELLDGLPEQFFAVQKQHRLPVGDFPPIPRFKEVASVSLLAASWVLLLSLR
jgi:hypothetical protein